MLNYFTEFYKFYINSIQVQYKRGLDSIVV